jgi:PilZ domain
MERRGSTRTRYRLATEIVHAGVRHQGFLADISPRGAFVQTTRTLDPGSEIELRFVDEQLSPQVARARVTRRRNLPAAAVSALRRGMGVEWIDAPQFALALEGGRGIEIEIEIDTGDPRGSAPDAKCDLSPRLVLEPCVPVDDGGMLVGGLPLPEVAPSSAADEPRGEIALLDPPPLVEKTLECGPLAVRAEVAVIDEGELGEIDEIARSLGARTLRMRWGAQADPFVWESPPRLVVVSARVALAVPLGDAALGAAALGIAVCDSEASTLRARLRRQGYALVVQRSAHPETLRLLFASLLSRHRERRKQGRRAFGGAAAFWHGLRRTRGTLLDVSAAGASLLVASELPRGTKLNVRVPAKHAGGRALTLPCEVVRAAQSAHGTVLGLRFGALSARKKARVAALVSELEASGPVPFEDAAGRAATPAHEPRERRRSARVRVAQQALALDPSCHVARDILFVTELSLGGMRIEPHPRLARGAEVQLALQPPDGARPVMLRAEVARDDGEQGLVLRFQALSTTAKRALAGMLEATPEVEHTQLGRSARSERIVLGTLLEER